MENAKHDRRAFLRVAGGGAAIAAALNRGIAQARPQDVPPAATARSGDLCFMSAKDLAALIQTRKVSAREVMAAHLTRIHQVNPKINAIVARLDVGRLEALAQMCNGRYLTAGADDSNLARLLETTLPAADDERRLEGKFDLWADYGYWLAVLLVPFALLNFRRGAVALFVCVLLPLPAHASWWSDLWQTRDQQGFQALQEGEPERAGTLFENPQWQGVADYRSGIYRGADQYFSADASHTGSYTRGNALAHEG